MTVGNPISNLTVSDVCDHGIRIVNLFCNWVSFFNPTYHLIAGKPLDGKGPVLRTIQRLIPFVKGGAKNLKNWIFKSPLQRKIESLPISQQKSIRSLQKRIQEHEQKLNDFKSNPDSFDSKDFLKNAPTEAIRQKIINGRIKHLEQEIKVFKQNIQKIIDGNN